MTPTIVLSNDERGHLFIKNVGRGPAVNITLTWDKDGRSLYKQVSALGAGETSQQPDHDMAPILAVTYQNVFDDSFSTSYDVRTGINVFPKRF
jgi:hypothetical protein